MAEARSVHPSQIPISRSRKHNFFGENITSKMCIFHKGEVLYDVPYYNVWASQVVLMLQNPFAYAGDMRHGFDPGFGKIPWKRE